MDLSAWGMYLSIVAALAAVVVLHYRRREPAGRGRHLLAGLRAAALAVLVLLLFDPRLPGAGAAARSTVVLLDGSLSMGLPDVGGGTRWDAGRAAAAALGPDRVVVFGADGASALAGGGAVPDGAPGAPATRLAPALRAALESGAGRVVVLTDGAVEDAEEVRRLLAERPGVVELRVLGGERQGNLGIVELVAPAWARVGEEMVVRIAMAGTGAPARDSVTAVLRRGGRELARTTVPAPAEGRLAGAELRFTPREGAPEPVRLDVALEGDDAEPADDRRSAYVRIADRPAGVALVSFRPDQEPRFLLPVLERALGLPVDGWLALPPDRYVRLGTGARAGSPEDPAVVRRAVEDAALVVLHGLDGESPAWARRAAARGPALLFPGADADALPFPVGEPRPGDWYLASEVPASPVARLLAGVEPADAPPLTALRPAPLSGGAWAPLNARLARRGEARPVVVAGMVEDRRVAVALGDGYWRLAFADGPARDLYDRLWSAVAGWLAGDEGGGEGEAVARVRPARAVVARGEALRWLAPADADSLRVVLRPAEDPAREIALDTVVALDGGRTAVAAPSPGRYLYEARVVGDGPGARPPEGPGPAGPAVGELTVEPYSPEYTRAAVPLSAGTVAGAPAGATPAVGPSRPADGRPLRTTPWPFVAVLALLSAEWILRRRWGLR